MGEISKITTTVGLRLNNDDDVFVPSLSLYVSRSLKSPDWELELKAGVNLPVINTESSYSVGACIEKSSPPFRLCVESSNERPWNATLWMPF